MKYKIMFMALLAMCACAFFVSQADDSDAAVVASGTCGTNLNWEFDDATHVLTISGSGTVMDDMLENRPWESVSGNITRVIIPTTITNIGAGAFKDCTNLTVIATDSSATTSLIPNTVLTIGASAFQNCGSLLYTGSIYATTLGESAFENCTSINPSGAGYVIKTMPAKAFKGCTSINRDVQQFVVHCKTIGNEAFANCTHIYGNSLGNDVTWIGDGAFYGCISLNITQLNASQWVVTHVGSQAFYGCTSLKVSNLQPQVIYIGDEAFAGCTNLRTPFTVYGATTTLGNNIFKDSSVDKVYWVAGINFTGHTGNDAIVVHGAQGTAGTNISWEYLFDTTTLTFTGTGKVLEQSRYEATLPAGYIKLANADCTNIVFNTPNLTTIGNYAFSPYSGITSTQWSKVQTMDIPESVTKVGEYAFAWFKGLIEYMPNLQSCGDSAFRSSSLNWPALPESLNSIGAMAFYGTTVGVVDIHDGITLGTNAFEYNRCTQIIYNANITSTYTASNSPFYGCSYVTDITIGESVRSIPVNMFTYDTSVTKSTPITINWNATNCSDFATGNSCFQRYNVNTIIFGDNAQYIPSYLAENMKSTLESVSFNDGLESIGAHAFDGCTNLAMVGLPDSVTEIGQQAFYGCIGIFMPNLPSGIVNIHTGAFSGCPGVSISYLPATIEMIGKEAFKGCTAITQMLIPVGFDGTIGVNAFTDCTELSKILNLSELDIQLGSEDYGHIAYYADEVRDNIGSTAIVQQKQNVVHEVIEKSDAASKLLRVLPALMAIAVISFLCGLLYYRESERNRL